MPSPTGMKEIKEFFNMAKPQEFLAEWKKLSPKDKAEIKQGILDKSLTY